MTQPAQIPGTVPTGYLGAGKTTLLNRILTGNHGRNDAVVISELGVGNDLVVDAGEGVVEMNNGCICCTVRGDLSGIVGGLMKRKGQDGILIETTGLADPAPVAQTFFVDDDARRRTRRDAIVTVVDAEHLMAQPEDSHEAPEAIAFAERDRAQQDRSRSAWQARVSRGASALAGHACAHSARPACGRAGHGTSCTELLDRGAFDLNRMLEMEPGFRSGEDEHERDEHVQSISLKAVVPLEAKRASLSCSPDADRPPLLNPCSLIGTLPPRVQTGRQNVGRSSRPDRSGSPGRR